MRSLIVAIMLTVWAAPLRAQEGPEVFFQPAITTQSFTGEVGRYASASIGVSATQGVQFDLVGAFLTLATNYHLTNQPPPPYTRGLQTFGISAGLRLRIPIEPVEPHIGIEYTNLGVVSNTLNRFTGSRLNFNALGLIAAAKWRIAPPIYVEVSGHGRYFIDMLNPTLSFGVSIALGLGGRL
ncbi:MAG: hypothetical protein ACJAYU_003102 [Bradymonadia bacterium]|jgi:hypothetical protein